MDIASEVCSSGEQPPVPPFLVLGTDGIWDETSANTVVEEVRVLPGIGDRHLLSPRSLYVVLSRRHVMEVTQSPASGHSSSAGF